MALRRRSACLLSIVILGAMLSGCSGGDLDVSGAPVGQAEGEPADADGPRRATAESWVDDEVPWSVTPGVDQLTVRTEPNTGIRLVHPDGENEDRLADDEGAIVFRYLGSTGPFTLKDFDGNRVRVRTLTLDDKPEPASYANQELEQGFNYLTMRDGTTLSAFVSLPGPAEDGPYPTVVEYSGYTPSDPYTDLSSLVGDLDLAPLCRSITPALCAPPNQPGSQLAAFNKYAVVGINVRGTGCSGGAYDFFDDAQLADAYDSIEIVAAQDWVKNSKVGTVGLSYPGISQLFIAATQPPSLAAITPMSVISDAAGTVRPNGIVNEGFGVEWVAAVGANAEPFGQSWTRRRVDEDGDTRCAANQEVRGQNVDLISRIRDTEFVDETVRALDLRELVDRIEVPVFFTSQWQDEQTGGHFHQLLDDFTNVENAHFRLTNGAHADGFAPFNLIEWKSFLDLYVDEEIPSIDPFIRNAAPLFLEGVFGAAPTFPPDRFDDLDSHQEALDRWESESRYQILFENGAGDPEVPGSPVPRFEAGFDTWPVVTEATRWWLGPDGTLTDSAPGADGGASSFENDPEGGEIRTTDGNSSAIFQALPDYTWEAEREGQAVVFESQRLEEDLVMIGSASVDLQLQVDGASDTDLEVMLSEVRPDDSEMLVQTGLTRASYRKPTDASTALLPVKSGEEADWALLDEGWNEVRIETHGFAHVFRAGSRVRLIVDTPGRDEPLWSYEVLVGDHVNIIGHSSEAASSIALPVYTGDDIDIAPGLAPCPSLRGQPCRPYEAFTNTTTDAPTTTTPSPTTTPDEPGTESPVPETSPPATSAPGPDSTLILAPTSEGTPSTEVGASTTRVLPTQPPRTTGVAGPAPGPVPPPSARFTP